jgi:predicted nuclease with TOPRIM domain
MVCSSCHCQYLSEKPERTMSENEAVLKEKQELIGQMLEMQKKFIDLEHQQGVTGKDYWASQDGLLADYRHKYAEMAERVVDLAHQAVGSRR